MSDHHAETSDEKDDPSLSSLGKANRIASDCFSIAIGMVVPGLLGYWLDGYLGTQPGFTLAGFAFGFGYGIWRLVLLGQSVKGHQVTGSKTKYLTLDELDDLDSDDEPSWSDDPDWDDKPGW